MNALTYLLQVNLYLLFFYLFYLAVLRNETFFRMNRLYLVGSALISLIIPYLKVEWIKELFITEEIQAITQAVTLAMVEKGSQFNTLPVATESHIWPSPVDTIWMIYLFVSLLFLINFLTKLYDVRRLMRKNVNGQAFSFFNAIKVDDNLHAKDTIVRHEMAHAKEWHSADVIFFELLLVINWFNPISYLYRKTIKNIHEFIADDLAASTLENRSAYALLLVSNVFNTQPHTITNNFFNQSQLKRRIIMLHKTKSRKTAILKYGLSVPLFASMLILSSATEVSKQAISTVARTISPLIERTDSKVTESEMRHSAQAKASVSVKQRRMAYENRVLEDKLPEATPKNLFDYVSTLYQKVSLSKVKKEGNIYVSFRVGKDKKPRNFTIMKSIGSDWEHDLLNDLKAFDEQVDMPKGNYHFILGFAFGGNDELLDIGTNEHAPIFKKWRVEGPAVGTAMEMENGVTIPNTYVSFVTLSNPIILVDGKEAAYTHTKMGLRLAETIHPRESGRHIALKGDKAVEKYGEIAREGIIVIETKEKEN